MNRRLLSALLLATCPVLCAAQGAIYESKDKAGPVFSDQPSSGVKPLDLPPPNVIGTQKAQPQPAPAAPPLPYGQLRISSPADQATVNTNTGAFAVRVQALPALRTARGDVIRVKLDGTPLQQSYSSTKIQIADTDWARAAKPDSAEHTLQVAIVSSTGAVLIESAPVSFSVRRSFQHK